MRALKTGASFCGSLVMTDSSMCTADPVSAAKLAAFDCFIWVTFERWVLAGAAAAARLPARASWQAGRWLLGAFVAGFLLLLT